MNMRVVGRYCPVCGAEGMTLWLGGYTGAMYHCQRCDYVGPIVIERDPTPGEESDTSREKTRNQ